MYFGNYQTVGQKVVKYHDHNADGVKDGSGDEVLSGWQFFIDTNANEVWDSGVDSAKLTTDANGEVTFSGLVPGASYSICEVLQGGWSNSDPTGTTICESTGTVVSGTPLGTMYFGNYQTVGQKVVKYHDHNADGVKDGSGDEVLSGWQFFIDTNANEVWDSGVDSAKLTTDANGEVTFSGLVPGASYSICEVLQGGWSNSDPTGTTICESTGTVVSGTPLGTMYFGNYADRHQDRHEVRRPRRRRRQGRRRARPLGLDDLRRPQRHTTAWARGRAARPRPTPTAAYY